MSLTYSISYHWLIDCCLRFNSIECCVGMLPQRGEDQSKLLAMNQYYTAAAAAAAAANPNMSPASAISLIQAAMTPPPALQGMCALLKPGFHYPS